MSNAFRNFRIRIEAALKDLPLLVGNEVVNHSQNKFVEGQGSFDNVKWQEPKRKFGTFTKASRKARASTRATLVETGALRRSLRITKKGKNFVSVGSNLPYASVHNFGGKAGRGEGFQMEQRQFLGNEPELIRKLNILIKNRFRKA